MDLAERLIARAEATDRSLHSTIVLALKDYAKDLDRDEKIVEQFKEFRPPTQLFKCPVHGCAFRAGSDKARCPSHGRTVIPA